MLEKFKKHIEDHFPILLEHPFLLACSAGIDSVVLVQLCARCQMDFAIAHVNFRLRGTDSEGDEVFVRELAGELNKKFYVTQFETNSYILKHKVTLQVGARDLRYAWFAEIMAQNNIGTLVTAHHADDALETFMINLSRGTGLDGLTGIPALTDTIARPLLAFDRSEILDYAKSEGLAWREDYTNAETKYIRNKIRHQIVPLLKELHPTFQENFKRTLAHLSDSAAVLENHIAKLSLEIFKTKGDVTEIKIADLQLQPRKTYLYLLFKDYGFTAWDDIDNLLTANSGKEVHSKTHRLVKDRDHLLLQAFGDQKSGIYNIRAGQEKVQEPVVLNIQPVENMGVASRNVLYVDKETLKYPLVVRKWKKGDYFYPFGMGGRKKLSKYFKDEKIDVLAKEKQWLLCSDGAIVWVIGRRSDERFKVSGDTKEIIKIELNT